MSISQAEEINKHHENDDAIVMIISLMQINNKFFE